ncbi:MAG: hypothetical protein J6O71_03915 [Lachnospiraceae bacterium]|nr:hypothetical protein [Lachnospiraceae bacterium]
MEKQRNAVDRFLKGLVEKYFYELAAAVILLFSIAITIKLATFKFNGSYISGDFNNYLLAWITQYRQLGIVDGLASRVGNYYVPYNLYLALLSVLPVDEGIGISFLSCLFEYIAVIYVYKFLVLLMENRTEGVFRERNRRAMFVALMLLYLPSCMLNGTLWKQCDAIYTCFIIIAMYKLFQKKFHLAFFIFGIAFIFKLQTLFMIPFLVVLYLLYFEFSIFEFLWFPGMYIAAGLPAIACGKSVYDTYATYFRQGVIGKMTVGFPNVYCFGLDSYEAMTLPALLICASIFVFAAVFFRSRREAVTPKLLLLMAGWLFMTCPMFLPGMHSRYDYMAILLITAYTLAFDIRMAPAAVIMNVIPMFTYGSYLFHEGNILLSYQALALMYLFAYL